MKLSRYCSVKAKWVVGSRIKTRPRIRALVPGHDRAGEPLPGASEHIAAFGSSMPTFTDAGRQGPVGPPMSRFRMSCECQVRALRLTFVAAQVSEVQVSYVESSGVFNSTLGQLSDAEAYQDIPLLDEFLEFVLDFVRNGQAPRPKLYSYGSLAFLD
jgi:hypothetical protein